MRMLIYDHFARTRNWTPRQVDELHFDELEWLPLIAEAVHEANETISEQERKQR